MRRVGLLSCPELKAGGIAFLPGISVLVVLRGTSELALMSESGSDLQMGILIKFLVAKLVYGLFAGSVVAGVLFFEKPRWRIAMGMRWKLRDAIRVV
jgi:hypothetical protein